MTLAEVERYFKSKARVMKAQERKQASFDYMLAELIGRSMSRVYSSANKMPPIYEVYPTLFSEQEIIAERAKRDRERFMAGLQQFANSYNKKFEEVATDE